MAIDSPSSERSSSAPNGHAITGDTVWPHHPICQPPLVPDVPLGDTLRGGPTGAATQVRHHRRAVDVEHRGELRDRGAGPSLEDEVVYLRGIESRLPLTLWSDAFRVSTTTFSGIIR